jgi:hypothetical protein
MAKTIDQILAERKALYDPQRQAISEQVAALPGEETAAIGAADAALGLARDENLRQANAKGMAFSGNPTLENNKYAALTYAPRIAEIKSGTQQRRYKLQDALSGINQSERGAAEGIQSDQIKAEQEAAYRAEQLAIQRSKAAAKTAKEVDPAKGFRAGRDAGGGLSYRDDRGNPITAAQYYDAKGATGIAAIIADLQSSRNTGDAQIAKDASSGKFTYDELAQKYPRVFGGI